jgi:positive regulator of sigma E activity
VASAIPPSAPFSAGLDAERFAQHYAAAQLDLKLRLKQRIFTVWYFYFAPLALGLLPGTLLANHLFNPEVDGAMWAAVTYGVALVLTPALMAYRRKKHNHRRYQQFYSAALERCIAEEQGRA